MLPEFCGGRAVSLRCSFPYFASAIPFIYDKTFCGDPDLPQEVFFFIICFGEGLFSGISCKKFPQTACPLEKSGV